MEKPATTLVVSDTLRACDKRCGRRTRKAHQSRWKKPWDERKKEQEGPLLQRQGAAKHKPLFSFCFSWFLVCAKTGSLFICVSNASLFNWFAVCCVLFFLLFKTKATWLRIDNGTSPVLERL